MPFFSISYFHFAYFKEMTFLLECEGPMCNNHGLVFLAMIYVNVVDHFEARRKLLRLLILIKIPCQLGFLEYSALFMLVHAASVFV